MFVLLGAFKSVAKSSLGNDNLFPTALIVLSIIINYRVFFFFFCMRFGENVWRERKKSHLFLFNYEFRFRPVWRAALERDRRMHSCRIGRSERNQKRTSLSFALMGGGGGNFEKINLRSASGRQKAEERSFRGAARALVRSRALTAVAV
jgi:hypothetical protein